MKKLTLPLLYSDISSLKAGDFVQLSGKILTGRDAAHKRLCQCIQNGERLPTEICGQVIYYVGPAPAKPGQVVGPAGPTSSYRMDAYTPTLLEHGLVGMIGKGSRSDIVCQLIVKHHAVYFVAIGGAAALLSQSITNSRVLCYDDLGTEAIHEFTVENFPIIAAIDCFGGNIYDIEPAKYRTPIIE